LQDSNKTFIWSQVIMVGIVTSLQDGRSGVWNRAGLWVSSPETTRPSLAPIQLPFRWIQVFSP